MFGLSPRPGSNSVTAKMWPVDGDSGGVFIERSSDETRSSHAIGGSGAVVAWGQSQKAGAVDQKLPARCLLINCCGRRDENA